MNRKNKWLVIIQCVLIGIITFLFCYNDWCYSIDTLMKDRLCQRPRTINNDIKIIAIDEKTLEELGPTSTWTRKVYADLLDVMGDYPVVTGFDIMFIGDTEEESDRAFEEAVDRHPNVVMASHLLFESVATIENNTIVSMDNMHIAQVETPYFDKNVEIGYANISSDADGIVRSLLPFANNGEESLKVFSYAVYEAYCKGQHSDAIQPKTDQNGKQWIYYAGKPFEYESVSLVDVLNEKVDPRIFTDCIVLVGAYATGLQDQFSVPNSSNQMYGVEIHANIIQSYMDQKFPLPVARWGGAIVTSFIAAALYFLFRKIHIRLSSIIIVCCEGLLIGAGILLFTGADIIIPLAYGIIFFFFSYILALVENYVLERAEKKKISSAFRKYVAPQVVDEIMKSGQFHIRLGGENRDIAVLFVDIRGFTPLSESLQPEQVVEILNLYLNLTTSAIFKNSGTLDKFIGDATMAVFNAPFDLDDYVFRAVSAAWDILDGARALEERCMERFGKAVSFGVGVNCGPAVAGNIGCDFRMDYTAIGDTVNTAARLEANAKRGQVLISQAVYDCVKDRVEVEPIGEIPLKGKSQGVFVYSLTAVEGKEKKDESSVNHT